MRLRLTAVSLALPCLAATACGGSSNSSSHSTATAKAPPTLPPSPEVRRFVDVYAKAVTPQQICSLLSYGYKLALAPPGQSPTTCTSWIAKRLGPFTKSSSRIISTTRVGGSQIAVFATFNGQRQALFLIKQCGSLKLGSTGAPRLKQPSPPQCPA